MCVCRISEILNAEETAARRVCAESSVNTPWGDRTWDDQGRAPRCDSHNHSRGGKSCSQRACTPNAADMSRANSNADNLCYRETLLTSSEAVGEGGDVEVDIGILLSLFAI